MADTPPVADTHLPDTAARSIGRIFFGSVAGVALASAVMLSVLPPGLPVGERVLLVSSLVALAALCGLAMRANRSARFPINAALCATALGAMALTGLVSLILRAGLHSPALGFLGLIVCATGAIAGRRISLVLGGVAALLVGALAWGEVSGMMLRPALASPLSLALLYHWLIILCATVAAMLIAQVLGNSLAAAKKRDQRFRTLLRVAADWYWELDRDLRFAYTSKSPPGISGINHLDRLNRTPWELADTDLSDEEMAAHRADLEAHRPFNGLLTRRRNAQGVWCTISSSGEPRFDAGGMFTGYWGVSRDVSNEVRSQDAITASETRYRELFTRSPSPLFLHRRGIVFDANDAAARMFGFANAAAMNGFDIMDLFPAGAMREQVAERVAWMESQPVGAGLALVDLHLRAIDGRALSVQATGVRVDTASGPATLAIYMDITARHAAEAALRRSEAMLSHLFANSPDCISLVDAKTGRYAMVNPAMTQLFGYSDDEAVGRTASELGVWHDLRERDQLTALMVRDGSVSDHQAVFVTKAGLRLTMQVSARRFMMDDRPYLVFISHDVTASERTRMQHAAILERASIGIAFTRDRQFVQANPFFERMFGWAPGEIIGQPGSVVWATEDDYRNIRERAGPLLSAGQSFEAELRMSRRDGTTFLCRLMGQAVDPANPIEGGTTWIAEDVTERRRLDEALAAARDAAEAASRAKSRFLANTSHEIRTPLNGLLGLARLAMQSELPEARRQQYLAQILDSAQSLSGIMSDVLDVSKIEAGKITLEDLPFDLHDTLRAVHRAYEPLAEAKGLALQLVVAGALPAAVRGDPVRVRQILSNFITNALKFTGRGRVRIEASQMAGGRVRLAVTDTGAGVPPDMLERLFTPFSQGDSSTTRRFGGTGLGLSICRDLAQLMGGRVGVDSAVGRGSTFWAELPLPGSAPAVRPADTEAADCERLLGAHVLMAEDNPVNMMIAVAMLEQWGVRVAQAFDGRAAVAAVHQAARSGDPFNAVLMDVQMPVMSGHEASLELRHHYRAQALPIIALTAAALVSERDEALASGMDDFLTKPIDAPKLRATLAWHVGARHRDPA